MNRKFYVTLLSIINVIRSFLLVGQAIISKELIDEAVKVIESKSSDKLVVIGIVFCVAIILNIALSLIYFQIKNKFSLRIEVDLKKKIYDSLLKKDVAELKKYHSGELSNIYLSDVQNIKNGVCEIVPSFFLFGSRFILAFIALIYLDYKLLLILLILGVIGLVGARIYNKYMKRIHKATLENDGSVNAFMQETFENIKVVKALDGNKNVSSSLEERLKENYRLKNKRNNIALIGNGGLFILMQMTSAFTLIYGAIAIAFMGLSYGSLMGLMQVVSYFESPLTSLSSLLSRLNAYKASLERIEAIYALKDDEKQIELPDFDRIVVDNISFKYDKEIFTDFSLVIEKNKTILLKGPSGVGKSTLFNLLLGFIKPEKGEIYAEYNGVKYPISTVRKLFSYVPQENILFSGTVEDNIKIFIDDVDEEKLNNALKIAEVYDEIYEKPKGLKTPLVERGGGLSLGQIQRVLLAISLLKDHLVLLLDEFTSALDKDLEKRIVSNISSLNKTKVIITHRDIEVNDSITVNVGENNEYRR